MATSQLPVWTRMLAEVGDPEGTRAIGSIVALLVALGLALVMVAVWLYRATRPDPELLAPLEAMGERRWRRRDPVWQRRQLDELRPRDAEPLEPSVAPPDIDEAFDLGPVASGFDDLHAHGLHGDHPGGSLEPDPEPGEPLAPPPPGAAPVDAVTPRAIERPDLDDLADLSDGDIDPAALAAAMAELDAELGGGDRTRPASTGD